MPLKKLWNSLCGRSAQTDSAPVSTPSSVAAPDRSPAKPDLVAGPATSTPPPRRRALSMVMGGEHDALIKAVRKCSPQTILEVGVGDGSRMPAILAAISADDSASTIKAAVIDQFEMGDGSVQMRDYHKRLIGLPIRPAIFPEPAGRGLVSVANRLGRMDVILIDASLLGEEAGQAKQELLASINKVVHPATSILSNVTGKWTTFVINQVTTSDTIQRAA